MVESKRTPAATPALRARIVVPAALVILALQVAGFHSLRHDDAFITFRYGQNLASGHGLVFNPGERSMASTAHAHALLSAAGHALAGKQWLPGVMSALGCLGWLAQAAAVFFMLRLALGDRGAGFAALVALAGLLRPDAHLVALPLGLACVRELRAPAWRPAAGSVLLAAIAATFLFRTAHYAQIHERGFWFGARDAVYREVADYLRLRTNPGEVVAANEVGTIAYYAELPVLDLLGLVTPSPEDTARRLGPRLRFFVDLTAYSGWPLPGAVFRADSEPIHPDELFPPGRDRFSAAVVPWHSPSNQPGPRRRSRISRSPMRRAGR